MEQQQLDSFKQVLIDLRAETEALIRDSKEAQDTVELDQSKVGRLSRMDALQSQQMAKESTRRRQLLIQKIDSSLRRIGSGEYGYCVECGNEIKVARLEFDPTSTWCMCETEDQK